MNLWHMRCIGSTAPAAGELRLEHLAAVLAGPGRAGRRGGGAGQGAQRGLFVGIVDIQLRPGFQHRQIPQGAGQVLIAQFALNPGGQQHVAGMRYLYQRRGTEHSLHESACLMLRVIASYGTSRKDLKNALTSSPRSKTSTKAEPTTTPSTWPAKLATCCRERMPNPAHTGTLEQRLTRSMYSSTSAGTPAVGALGAPVVPVMVTAYTKPCAPRHNIANRSGGVTGVTICTNARPSRSRARLRSSLSSKGRSGTMNPATPAAAAARGSASSPKLSSGVQ